MKALILTLLIIVLASLSGFGQSNKKETVDFDIKGFKPFPKEYEHSSNVILLSQIIPDSAYTYWEIVKINSSAVIEKTDYQVIASHGDSLNYAAVARHAKPKYGWGLFGPECQFPSECYTYLVGVSKSGEVDVVEDFGTLKTIIGTVDSVEEILLHAQINGYWFDKDTLTGGAYKERGDDYLLYLLEYDSTSKDGQTATVSYKSIKAILTKSGEFRVIGKKVYKQVQEPFSFH